MPWNKQGKKDSRRIVMEKKQQGVEEDGRLAVNGRSRALSQNNGRWAGLGWARGDEWVLRTWEYV